jgi:hypothetical protein
MAEDRFIECRRHVPICMVVHEKLDECPLCKANREIRNLKETIEEWVLSGSIKKGEGMTIVSKFNMHDQLKDSVSGFAGQVLGITQYNTGCIHYGLAPRSLKPDGSVHTWEWFDESRLELVQPGDKAMPLQAVSGPDMNPKMK